MDKRAGVVVADGYESGLELRSSGRVRDTTGDGLVGWNEGAFDNLDRRFDGLVGLRKETGSRLLYSPANCLQG